MTEGGTEEKHHDLRERPQNFLIPSSCHLENLTGTQYSGGSSEEGAEESEEEDERSEVSEESEHSVG